MKVLHKHVCIVIYWVAQECFVPLNQLKGSSSGRKWLCSNERQRFQIKWKWKRTNNPPETTMRGPNPSKTPDKKNAASKQLSRNETWNCLGWLLWNYICILINISIIVWTTQLVLSGHESPRGLEFQAENRNFFVRAFPWKWKFLTVKAVWVVPMGKRIWAGFWMWGVGKIKKKKEDYFAK